MNLSIIIPTYNEKENIQLIIGKIIENLKNKKINYSIIIVDDNSPDGTGKIIDEISQKNKRVFIVHRKEKLGVGGAYVEGFKFSLKKLKPDLLMTMDADLSHDPRYICDIVSAIKDYDIVIGSRYVKGGKIVNWGIVRRVISRGANLLAKYVLGLKNNDCTAGFKCFKREIIESIDFSKISSNGYSFILEMLYICKEKGFKIGEVPIVFVNRSLGESKISKKEMYQTFKLLLKLKFNKNLFL